MANLIDVDLRGKRLPIPHYYQPLLPADYDDAWLEDLSKLCGTVGVPDDAGDDEDDVTRMVDLAAANSLKKVYWVRGAWTGQSDPTITTNDAAKSEAISDRATAIDGWGFTPDIVLIDSETFALNTAPAEDPDRAAWLAARQDKHAQIISAVGSVWTPPDGYGFYAQGWAIPQMNETTWGYSVRYGDWVDSDDPSGDYSCTVFYRNNRTDFLSDLYHKRGLDVGGTRLPSGCVLWVASYYTNGGGVEDWEDFQKARELAQWVKHSNLSWVWLYPGPGKSSGSYAVDSDVWFPWFNEYARELLKPSPRGGGAPAKGIASSPVVPRIGLVGGKPGLSPRQGGAGGASI